MSMVQLTYVLICSVSFAAMDLLRKLLTGRIRPMVLVFLVSVGSAPAMAAWLVVSGRPSISTGYLFPGLGSLVLNFLANLGFVYSLKLSPLSRTIPFLSLTPVFTSLMAMPLLHEYPSWRQGVGIAFVVGGAMVLNTDQAEDGSGRAFVKAMIHERGSLLMTGVAFLWSLAVPLDKRAISASSPAFHGLILSMGVALGALVFLIGKRRVGALGALYASKWPVLLTMVCASLSLAFQLLSIQVLFVSLVETFKRAVGSFMAVVLGRLVFREKVTVHKVVTVGAMVMGVVLVLG